MKTIKLTKARAFYTGLISIMFIFSFNLFFAKSIMETTTTACIGGIVGLVALYISGNVADNGVKGKFWNPNMESIDGNKGV